MTLLELAYKLRPYIEKAAMSLSNEDALEAIDLFPNWNATNTYNAGDRVKYNGILYDCILGHEAQDAWTPEAAPSLWTKVLAVEGEIKDWEQPESTNGYKIGDIVRFEGKIYESVIDNNIWSPAGFPAGWREINI